MEGLIMVIDEQFFFEKHARKGSLSFTNILSKTSKWLNRLVLGSMFVWDLTWCQLEWYLSGQGFGNNN